MSQGNKTEFSKKHPSNKKPSKKILEAVKSKVRKGEMPCSLAFEVAKELDVDPLEVGFALDYLEIPIVKCQLGLFGYKPQKKILKTPESVPPSLKEAIQNKLVDGKITCNDTWAIAESMGLGKSEVASVCEAMGIKISQCQLGAF
ncbi:MAG TPA: hypothetical protein EYP06_09975 [Desulfobacterales bacterium]|nr:hypothetical protein [Desulfobacterales bacterium]